MDPEKVIIQFKRNAKDTHFIAYCEEYPEVEGIGPTEGHAIANFWKNFNNADDKLDHQKNQKKKEDKKAA